MPDHAQVRQTYEKEYSQGESFNLFYAGLSEVRQTEAQLRLGALRNRVHGHDLLDVGSGMGYFVQAALEQGWNAQGVEISEQAVALQKDQGLPVFCSDYESFEPGKLYDVITLWALLEHVADPKGMLEKTYDLLKPGGIAVIETGDISSRNASRDGKHWRMFFIAGHLYFFSDHCLDQVLKEIGFTVVGTQLDKWIEHTLMQNEIESSVLTANRILPRFAVRWMSSLKHYVNRTAGRLGFGDVMIKIARKPLPA
jgi:2-polyprenyl-3-methyl-5-hydroxy-6-metoxy-1,4-benzoquinol methylase